MTYEFVTHVDLYRLVMKEAFTPEIVKFGGYQKYVITKEHVSANEILDVAATFQRYGAKLKYVGKYFTADYITVDVYGVEHCPDEIALLIKMAL